jgi:hypothetical protein
MPSARPFKGAVSAASAAKAKQAFKNFSLSKFAGDGMPSNHVTLGQPAASVQRRMISQQINQLNNANAPIRALTISFPEATLKQFLPSLNKQTGTIDLGELMRLVQQSMRGTEFYANGNPTLNRLAIQTQVQQLIAGVKQDIHQ